MKSYIAAVLLLFPVTVRAQGLPAASGPRSPGRALALSLALPGLGHRYAAGGRWGGTGTVVALVDAALWTSLAGTVWGRHHLIDTYETLATVAAGADMRGKDRTFALRLASYRSSDEFVEVSLRNRAWENLSYVDDPSFRWEWTSDEDYLRFRALRNDSETLSRRTSVIVATLVANRLLSGFLAARAARGADSGMAIAILPPGPGRSAGVDFALRF